MEKGMSIPFNNIENMDYLSAVNGNGNKKCLYTAPIFHIYVIEDFSNKFIGYQACPLLHFF